jgi:hypothetical protein
MARGLTMPCCVQVNMIIEDVDVRREGEPGFSR